MVTLNNWHDTLEFGQLSRKIMRNNCTSYGHGKSNLTDFNQLKKSIQFTGFSTEHNGNQNEPGGSGAAS